MNTLESRYKNTYWWYFTPTIVLIPSIFYPNQGVSIFVSVVLAIILACIVLYKAIILFKKTPGSTPLLALFFGGFLVAGGSFIDMTVTFIFSPDLSEEGNPVILCLLNNNASLWFIYLFTLLYQTLKVSINLYLWACFLKTYPNIIKTIPYLNFFTTIRWLMGCGKASLLDCFLGRNLQYHYLMSSVIFIIVMSCFSHWYAAMEWLKIIPIIPSTTTLVSCIVFIALSILSLITHFKLRLNHQYYISNNLNNKINSDYY